MTALLVCSEYPFPARNGVTIPISNYVIILEKMDIQVDILTIYDSKEELSFKNKNKFSCHLKKNKLIGITKELIGIQPYCTNYGSINEYWNTHLYKKQYSFILASPFCVIKIALELRKLYAANSPQVPKVIIGLSDCYTAELWNVPKDIHFLGFDLYRPSKLLSKFRSKIIAPQEIKLLNQVDSIFVQSSRDKAWIRKLGGKYTANKVKIFTNGVDSSLFNIAFRYTQKKLNFCYVADLNIKHYKELFEWFYNEIWMLYKNYNYTLYIQTKPLQGNYKLWDKLRKDKSVIINDKFIKNIADIYRGKDIAVAPIFKNYGFINKVGEAMAAGLLVIGDKSAFNAIKGFKNNVHGIVFSNENELKTIMKKLDSNIELIDNIKYKARVLAKKELQWSTKKNIFCKEFKRLNIDNEEEKK